MRNLKFRAWDIAEKRYMVDEAIFINAEGESFYYTDEAMVLNGWTIEQSTGLKDKNGVEIFEGDVVSYDSNTVNWEGEQGVAEVRAIHDTCNLAFWWLRQETENPTLFSEINYFGCAKELEVLGSIHANPDLLQEYLN